MSPGSSHARHLAEAGRLANEIRLSVEQVSYAYSAYPAQAPLFTLEATSFQARPGEIVAILGPNASGKSTLLKLVSGELAPLSGRILLNAFVTHSLTPRTRAQRIAVVQQESRLLFPAAPGNLSFRAGMLMAARCVLNPKTTSSSPRMLSPRWGPPISAIAGWTRFPAAKSSVSFSPAP